MQNQNHAHNVLDTSRIGSLLMKLTAPMFFGMIIQNIYQIVDTIFVGRYVGTDGLAALSVIMPIQMMVFGTGNMVSIGGASLISRLIGQREQLRAERALGNSIFFAILFSIAVTLIIVPFTGFWLKLLGTSPEVLPYASDYLKIIIAGTIFTICGAVLLALARAEGNARVSMISMIIQSVLNIGLDAVFMIGLKMGIGGAALAMIISQGIALIYVLSYYFMGDSFLKIRLRNLMPDRKIVRDIFVIGVSQFIKAICDCLSAAIIVKMIGRYGGDISLSTFGILLRLMTFASMPSMVLGQAMQPILGFNYGAKRFRQVLKSIIYPALISVGLGTVALLIVLALPGPIINIFTDDADLIDSAVPASKLMLLGLPVFSFFAVGQLVFPSIGKAMSTFLISVIRPLFFIIPATLILPPFLGVDGVWLQFPISDFLAFLLVMAFLIPLIKKFRKDARESTAGTEFSVPQPRLDTETPVS